MRAAALICLLTIVLLPPASFGAGPPHPSLPGLPNPKAMVGDIGRFGGTFLDAQVSDPRTFNPVLAQETSSTGPLGNLFEGLVEDNGETTETEPALAESWTTSPDGRTWMFVLRQGLQWEDGTPLTADDVVFTFQVIYDKNIPNSLSDVLTVAGKPIEVTKVDARTIRFRTAEPFGPFLRSIGIGIIPQHKLLDVYEQRVAAPFYYGGETPSPAPGGSGPRLHLSQSAGAAGDKVTSTGEGFAPKHQGTLLWEDQTGQRRVLGRLTTDAQGRFSITFAAPHAQGTRHLVIAEIPTPERFNQAWGVNTPSRELVGTGPYIMTEYRPAQRIVYVRNPHYWKIDAAGHRLPYIDRVVLTIVPDQNANRLLFQGGQTDSYGVRPREYAEFKRGERAGNYTVYDGGPTFGTEFLMFNENPRSGLPDYELKWFQTQKFRQGVAYAVDRQAIINQVYAGHAIPQYGPESPADKFFFDPRVMQYPYDLTKAQETLAAAGFTKGSDGVLRDAGGHPVQFVISTNSDNADRVAIANIVRQDLTKLGMQVTLAPEAFNTLVNKLVESFKWEAMVLGLTGGIDPHNGQNVWKSSGSLHMWYPKEPSPATSWEAQVDRYFNLAATTVDQNRRRDYYNQYQEIIAEQVPVIYTAIPNAYVAVRNKFGNIKFTAFGGPFWNFPVIYIKH